MHLKVKITYADQSSEIFKSTDFPSIGEWITLYNGTDRIVIPSIGIARIEYGMSDGKNTRYKSVPKDRNVGFRLNPPPRK